jgi:hypothetical protein
MTLDRKWEKFNGGPAGRMGEDIRVTINRKGHIYLNNKAYRTFGEPKAAALYYNREDDSIAVESANARSNENFQVLNKQNGWVIQASTFCRHYRIKVPNTERFVRPELDAEGNLILALRETVTVGGIDRKQTTKQTSKGVINA